MLQPKGVGYGVPVQCKYYKSANGSVDACFRRSTETGEYVYRYFQLDGKTPMMVEVPKDQYDAAVARMRFRIENGDVPGVADPNLAAAMV